jgi:3-hydroxymyristoyl/3-hydroxydecanoyl-(acyl carrier protein) dehydratase
LQGQHATCADRPSSIAQPSHRQGADIPSHIPGGNKVTQAQLFNGLINEEFASETVFGGRIAHGMLSASVISAAIANKLPGPGTIYMSQSLRFKAPVRPGDTVHAQVTVKEISLEKQRALLTTECFVGNKAVIEGEALVKATSQRSQSGPTELNKS